MVFVLYACSRQKTIDKLNYDTCRGRKYLIWQPKSLTTKLCPSWQDFPEAHTAPGMPYAFIPNNIQINSTPRHMQRIVMKQRKQQHRMEK